MFNVYSCPNKVLAFCFGSLFGGVAISMIFSFAHIVLRERERERERDREREREREAYALQPCVLVVV